MTISKRNIHYHISGLKLRQPIGILVTISIQYKTSISSKLRELEENRGFKIKRTDDGLSTRRLVSLIMNESLCFETQEVRLIFANIARCDAGGRAGEG